MTSRAFGIAWLCLVIGAAAACSGGDTQSESPPVQPEQIAARVNDDIVTVDDVKKIARNFALRGVQPDSEAQGDSYEEKLYYTVVDRLVEQALVAQETDRRGMVISEDEVQASVTQLKAMAGSEEAFQKILAENSISMDDVIRDTRTNLTMKAFYEAVVTETPSVTEEEIATFYEDNAHEFAPQPEVHARHILLRTQPDMDDLTRADVNRRAEAVLAEAKQTSDFAALAREHSEDEISGPNGGDLSWFRRGRMVAPFDSAAFALDAGEISGLVETQYGFHIIKVEERRESQALTLDQVRPNIEGRLTQEKSQALFKEAVAELRSAATVDIRPPSSEVLDELAS
jgi:parvulin-like peptidyl-prolyl isomerase